MARFTPGGGRYGVTSEALGIVRFDKGPVNYRLTFEGSSWTCIKESSVS
jgi:hypothetical protein